MPKLFARDYDHLWWDVAEISILKRWILSIQQEKVMDSDYCE